MATDADQLADRLHAWALDEMRFRPQGRHVNTKLPTPQDLQGLCRGQQMQDVWKFVLDRVRSKQTVRTVQGNLALRRRQVADGYKVKYQGEEKFSQERVDLLEERKTLLAELTSERTATSNAEREIERLRSEVATTDKQYQEVSAGVHAIHHKCALLTAHSQQVDEDVVRYKEYATRMADKAETLARHSEGEQLFYRSGRQDGEKLELETSSTRAVRESCGKIAAFLHSLLEGKYNVDKSFMQQEKEKLWQSIESDMAQFSAGHVVNSLELLAQTTSMDLREKTDKINIPRDAEKLKFKYENGRLMDTSSSSTSSSSLMQTVQHLVTERQGAHFQKFIETEKSRNETWHLQERLSAVMGHMEEALRNSHHGDPGAMELAKDLFEAEVEIAATRTALSVLDNAIDRLLIEVNEARKEKEALYAKYQKIQDFKKLADSKQNLIRVLVKQNVSARNRLELQQEEIAKYIDSTLMEHAGTTRSLTQQLKDSVNTEVDAFAKLCLPFLMFSLLESGLRLTVLDLSIHRLDINIQPSAGTSQTVNQHSILQQVLTALEFPPYKAPECLLPKVMELQQLVDDLESTLAAQEALVRSIEGKEAATGSTTTANWEQFQDLCRKVRSHDQQQIARLVPELQKGLSRATQALSDCLRLKDTSQDWWCQSAQSTVDWLEVDGMNMSQWRDKWLLAVTRLRQIQMS